MSLQSNRITWPRAAALIALLGLAGCASIQQPHRAHLDAADDAVRECARWYRALDAAVARAGVTDIAARRVAGFPYLRVDRFAAARRYDSSSDAGLRSAWIDRLRELDSDGRRIEIENLPAAEFEKLAAANRAALLQRARDCGALLAQVDLSATAADDLLTRRARVDDDYSSLKRALGLYELTRLPFYAGVRGWQDRAAQTIQATREGAEPQQPLRAYLPPATPGYTRQEVAALLARAARHPLGLAELSAAEEQRLFATYAPVFEIETGGDFDRIGSLYWSQSPYPRVDVKNPTVYHRLGYTRVGKRTLLQLVYVAWMPERPRDGAFDLLGGHLDGIVWRVTLAPDGEPVLYDSIHPCGCYHMFFPTPRLEPRPPPERTLEWAFIPVSLPRINHGDRVTVSLQTRTHYLRDLRTGTATGGSRYRFADYDELRSLPLPAGGSRSIFGADGIVPGTERGERFLFWPMGIKSAGAMRQAGSHATAFVGRRHFDDADIVDKRFRLID